MSHETPVRVRVLQLGRSVMDYAGQPGLQVSSALDGVGLVAAPGMDIRVNGTPADGATELRNGDIVTIIPRIKGGRHTLPPLTD